MAQTYSINFFNLQLEFARILSKKNKISYLNSLFLNTSLFVRLFGYHDEKPPKETDKRWQFIMKNKPTDKYEELNYFYKLYLDYEKRKIPSPNQVRFGCFSYSYHQDTHKFELHFSASDPKGNLNKGRQKIRISELRTMFKDIKKRNINTKIFVITWLLNIRAFYRLFPPEFLEKATLWNTGTAQNFVYWGQFVDKLGNLKHELADKLIENVKCFNFEDVNFYFPLPAKVSELPLKKFYEFYTIS